MDADKLQKSTTTDGRPPRPGFETAAAPAPIDQTGQHLAYWALSEEERAKGFVRPVRRSYRHVGIRPKYPLRGLTDEEKRNPVGYVAFEAYLDGPHSWSGRYWTQSQLDSGCGCITRMGIALAETWAANISYYGITFCLNCGKHFLAEEFVWLDDPGTGKDTERLGT